MKFAADKRRRRRSGFLQRQSLFQPLHRDDEVRKTLHGRRQPSQIPRGTSEVIGLLYDGQERHNGNKMSQPSASRRHRRHGYPPGLHSGGKRGLRGFPASLLHRYGGGNEGNLQFLAHVDAVRKVIFG